MLVKVRHTLPRPSPDYSLPFLVERDQLGQKRKRATVYLRMISKWGTLKTLGALHEEYATGPTVTARNSRQKHVKAAPQLLQAARTTWKSETGDWTEGRISGSNTTANRPDSGVGWAGKASSCGTCQGPPLVPSSVVGDFCDGAGSCRGH